PARTLGQSLDRWNELSRKRQGGRRHDRPNPKAAQQTPPVWVGAHDLVVVLEGVRWLDKVPVDGAAIAWAETPRQKTAMVVEIHYVAAGAHAPDHFDRFLGEDSFADADAPAASAHGTRDHPATPNPH